MFYLNEIDQIDLVQVSIFQDQTHTSMTFPLPLTPDSYPLQDFPFGRLILFILYCLLRQSSY